MKKRTKNNYNNNIKTELKGHLHYKMITSQNVSFETQFKFCFIL